MMMKFGDLKKPHNKQELRVFLGLCIHMLPYQHNKHEILHKLQPYKTGTAVEFEGEVFAQIWRETMNEV